MKLLKLLGLETKQSQPQTLHEYYDVISDPRGKDPAHWYVKVKKGPFTGLIYRYLTVQIVPNEDRPEEPTLKFEYHLEEDLIPDNLKNIEGTDEDKKQFHNFLGDILTEILDEHYREVENEKAGKKMKLMVESDPDTSLDLGSDE